MPPSHGDKSGGAEMNKPDEVAGCMCVASIGTKIYTSDDDYCDSTVGVGRNPSEKITSKLTVLELSGQGLESFPDTEDVSNVNVLNLSNNAISELPSSLISARFLRVLNLSGNKLTSFPSVLTEGLFIVKELNISRNSITSLPRPSCFQHLKELKARNSGITEFPLWIVYKMHFLEVLDLSGNPVFFKMAPSRPYAPSCNNFVRVNFSNTYMSDCHLDIISHFGRLEHLDVSNYTLKYMNSFQGLTVSLPSRLKVLKAINVRMVDKVNLAPTRVEKANLSQNSLVLLNEANISAHMRYLVLADCFLSYLPDNFGDMVNLVYLNLNNNDLSALPESFGNLTSLVHLDLYRNSFYEFPSEQLRHLKNITCFDMCMNPVDVPLYPLGDDMPPYDTLRAALRSALSSSRASGQLPTPSDQGSEQCYHHSDDDSDSKSSSDSKNSSDPKSSSDQHEPQVTRQCEEEEDWDDIDPNWIYHDPSLSLPYGGLNKTANIFAGTCADVYESNLYRVPARIRNSPFFFFRQHSSIVPSNSQSYQQLEDIAEVLLETANLFAGMCFDVYESNLHRVPARIRNSLFFFFRQLSTIVPSDSQSYQHLETMMKVSSTIRDRVGRITQ